MPVYDTIAQNYPVLPHLGGEGLEVWGGGGGHTEHLLAFVERSAPAVIICAGVVQPLRPHGERIFCCTRDNIDQYFFGKLQTILIATHTMRLVCPGQEGRPKVIVVPDLSAFGFCLNSRITNGWMYDLIYEFANREAFCDWGDNTF